MIHTYWHLAWHFFTQENRQLSQALMYLAQLTLMIFIVTLSLTSYSVQQYLQENLANLLGADAVVSQRGPLNESQQGRLSELANEQALVQTVTTTLTFGENWQSAKLKGVDQHYPLQGEMRVSMSLGGPEQAEFGGPAQGEIWLGPRLLSSLGAKVQDSISLAGQSFVISRVLLHEPDRLMQGHSVDMYAMLNLADFNTLGIAEDTVQYRHLLNIESTQIPELIDWQKNHLPAAQLYHSQGAHPLALFWQRTENFIGLGSIILFFMAAIAIEQLTRVKIAREQFLSAVLMSVGASRKVGLSLALIKWFLQLLLLLPIVFTMSSSLHWLLIDWLSHSFADLHWQWHGVVALKAFGAVSALFLVFQLPVWWSIYRSSAAKLIQQVQSSMAVWLSAFSAVLVLALVATFYSDNGLLTLMVLVSVGVCIALILVVSWLGLTVSERLSRTFSGLVPFALYMMRQRLMSKTTQILGVGLCAFLLLFTLMLMRDLGNTMSAYSRQHDGNLLVSQASVEQMTDIRSLAQREGMQIRQSKPYVYASLVAINQQMLSDYTDRPSESLTTMQSAIRLHWSEAVPANNRVVDGQWWQVGDADWQQVSVEEEVMTDLDLRIGDTLTFAIGDQTLNFAVAASHVYQAGAGSITFWIQMPLEAVSHITAPHYHMASLELEQNQFSMLAPLWREHPTLRMVSLKEMTARFDRILAIVTDVISGFSMLISLLAVIVIVSSIQGLEAKEKKKNSVILSFGFNASTCLKLNAIEWGVTALIAATGAIVGTYVAGLLIYQSQFSLNYQPDFRWLFTTLLIILTAVTSLGIVASKNSLRASVRTLMAE